MPKGKYLDDSNYYIGVLPNGKVKYYCEERDYLEEFYESLERSRENGSLFLKIARMQIRTSYGRIDSPAAQVHSQILQRYK